MGKQLMAELLRRMAAYNGTDVKRIGHAMKVYGYAQMIGGGVEMPAPVYDNLLAAAVLHDIGIHNAEQKYGSSTGRYQELEGPPVAHAMLEELGVPAGMTERVCFLVGHHHSYTKVDGMDFQALIEADFLVNIEEDGLSQKEAATIGAKYFRTEPGKTLLSGLFGVTFA